jgi:hypothetical protein
MSLLSLVEHGDEILILADALRANIYSLLTKKIPSIPPRCVGQPEIFFRLQRKIPKKTFSYLDADGTRILGELGAEEGTTSEEYTFDACNTIDDFIAMYEYAAGLEIYQIPSGTALNALTPFLPKSEKNSSWLSCEIGIQLPVSVPHTHTSASNDQVDGCRDEQNCHERAQIRSRRDIHAPIYSNEEERVATAQSEGNIKMFYTSRVYADADEIASLVLFMKELCAGYESAWQAVGKNYELQRAIFSLFVVQRNIL